ncbi:MAG TPA: HAMP domain-containing sensor histidine kinase, partial [Longimicrobiales bacterium]|nr:HAMP domain-containing sensor histidine kinase [Longimicrobiales bacterium]
MINRLLEQLENPRRHLTFLVGLLALVFVLTTVVAWRANAAERDRAQIARSTLDETAEAALNDWAFLYSTYVGNTLPHLAPRLANPTLSVDSLRKGIRVADICVSCDTAQAIRTAFTIDATTGMVESAGDPLDPRVGPAILQQIRSGRVSNFHDLVLGGLYFVELDGAVTTALVALGVRTDGSPGRIGGVVIDDSISRQMLEFAFNSARLLQTALAPGATQEELFGRSASIGGVRLLAHGSTDSPNTRDVPAPVYGLTLAVGPQESAAAFLEFGADPLTERLTIILLMLVISALLVLAVLQVRREAELSRLRADFVSGVSHELRTPLAQIRMFAETLLLGRVRSDVERRRSLEIIDQEARRLSYLVENVLLFSKTEGGRHARVMPEPTHFAEEVRQAVESFTLLTRNRQVEVRTELQENITVAVDRMALRQILVNLVDNALKYGPEGQRITVGAALFDDVARLWVDDEGEGIPV